MKIVCISDLHGNIDLNLPPGDVLVISGDICPATNHGKTFQAKWLRRMFNPWLQTLDFKDIVVIAGNHDFVFEGAPEKVPDLHCHYLQESSVIIDGYKFYGYPHQPEFFNWAFNRTQDELKVITERIPDDTNVLVTHGPPYGILDTITEGRFKGRNEDPHLGCPQLAKRVKELPNLMLTVFGHIHSGNGILDEDGKIFVNAAILNEQYKVTYNAHVVEI